MTEPSNIYARRNMWLKSYQTRPINSQNTLAQLYPTFTPISPSEPNPSNSLQAKTVDLPVKTVEPPVKSIDPPAKSVDPPVKSIDPATVKTVDPATVKLINPPIFKPIKPPIFKPIKPPIFKPVDPSTVKPVDPSTVKPVDPSTVKPVAPIFKLIESVAPKVDDSSMDQSDESLKSKPMDMTRIKSVDSPNNFRLTNASELVKSQPSQPSQPIIKGLTKPIAKPMHLNVKPIPKQASPVIVGNRALLKSPESGSKPLGSSGSTGIPIRGYVINLDDRPDRWNWVVEQFKLIRTIQPIRVSAIRDSPGWIGCARSHLKVIREAKMRGNPYVVVIEDDIMLTNPQSFDHRWPAILNWLIAHSNDWEIFVGGPYVFRLEDPPRALLDRDLKIIALSNCYDFQFVVYSARAYDKLLDWPSKKSPFDYFANERCTCITAYPMIAIQRPDYSDIQNKHVNYDHHFKPSEAYLEQFLQSHHAL